MAEVKLSGEQQAAYWHRTRSLMITILIVWFIFSFAIHFFAPQLNGIRILGFPLGYYMAAQGSLAIFVIEIAIYARLMNKKDEEYGIREEG